MCQEFGGHRECNRDEKLKEGKKSAEARASVPWSYAARGSCRVGGGHGYAAMRLWWAPRCRAPVRNTEAVHARALPQPGSEVGSLRGSHCWGLAGLNSVLPLNHADPAIACTPSLSLLSASETLPSQTSAQMRAF